MTSDLTTALEVSHIMRYKNRRILYLLYVILVNCNIFTCSVNSARDTREYDPMKSSSKGDHFSPHLSVYASFPLLNIMHSTLHNYNKLFISDY